MAMAFQPKHAFLVAAVAAVVGLTGCGGGGSGGTTPTNPGNGNNSGGGTIGASKGTKISGVVASGLASGAVVTATCGSTAVGTANTDAAGFYTVTLSNDCSAPVLLTATPASNGSTLVADELLGSVAVAPASGETWALRAYADPTSGLDAVTDPFYNTKHITPFSDMVAAVISDVIGHSTARTNTISGTTYTQQVLSLSSGLLMEANYAIAHVALGSDPNGILTNPYATPIAPAGLSSDPAVSPVAQQQLMVLLAALSAWGNPNYGQVPSIFNATQSTTCGDPAVCGNATYSSALQTMEKSVTDQVGVHLFIGDTLNGSRLVGYSPDTTQQSVMPAWVLSSMAYQLETASGLATNMATYAASIPTVAQNLASVNNAVDTVSSLGLSSQWYLQNGVVF